MVSIRLADLRIGDTAQVVGYSESHASYRMKLLALGLTRNVTIKLIKAAPLGDPIEIEVRGYRLSLRKAEAQSLLLRKVSHG